MTASASVLVVGGGVVGRACARAAAQAGHHVTIVAAPPGATPGASGLPAALLNPYRGRRGAAHPADLYGLERTWAWANELAGEGFTPGVERTGVWRVPDREAQANAWRAQAETDPGLSFIDPEDVDARLHAPFGVMVVRQGGWLRPDVHLAALRASFEASGGHWLEGLVQRVSPDGTRWRVQGDGIDATADVVLLATGAASPPGLPPAVQAVWPDLVRHEGDVRTVQATDLVGLAPVAGGSYAAFADGTAFVGGGHREPGTAADHEKAVRDLHVAWAVPALRDAAVVSVWTGVRAKTTAGRPVVQPLAPGLTAAVGFAGRGFLVAAAAAEAWAAQLSAGRLDRLEL